MVPTSVDGFGCAYPAELVEVGVYAVQSEGEHSGDDGGVSGDQVERGSFVDDLENGDAFVVVEWATDEQRPFVVVLAPGRQMLSDWYALLRERLFRVPVRSMAEENDVSCWLVGNDRASGRWPILGMNAR